MRKISDPFLSSFPYIDLHGEDRVGATVKTKEFINDSIKLKNKVIIIIHGKGMGIVKESVHDCLRNDKRVSSFRTDNLNDGMTIIEIKEEYINMKKGFTLVELLVIITLVGMVLLLVIPSINGNYTKAQKNMFYNDVISIYENATSTYLYKVNFNSNTSKEFCKDADSNTNIVNAEEDDKIYYYVKVNSSGKVTDMIVSNGVFRYTMPSSVNNKSDINKSSIISDSSELSCN